MALGSSGSSQESLGQEARLTWGVRGLYSVVRVEVRADPRNQHRTAWGPHHSDIREDRQLRDEEQPLVYPIRRGPGATFGTAGVEAGNRDNGGERSLVVVSHYPPNRGAKAPCPSRTCVQCSRAG